MKKLLIIAALIAPVSATYATSLEAVSKLATSCCSVAAACCEAVMACCA